VLVLRLPRGVPLNGIVAAGLGALFAASFLVPGGWALQIVVLGALFSLALRDQHGFRAARLGLVFGLGWFLVGISWIYVSMHTYGLMPWWLAALATLALSSYLALFPALALGLAGWLSQRGASDTLVLVLLPLFWTLSELLRGVLLTGFPWLATGYAQIDGPLAGYAPILGVYGVGLAVAAGAAALVRLQRVRFSYRAGKSAALVFIAVPLLGGLAGMLHWSKPAGEPMSVRLLQGNVAQDMKFDAAQFHATLDLYFDLIEQQRADLIVLPETALPIFFNDLPEDVIARFHHDADAEHAFLAVGAPVADSASVYTNSVVAFTPDSSHLMRYDKAHLVPFGEFVPLGFHWFVRLLRIPLGDFTSGGSDPQALMLAGRPVAFNICYEDLFGARIARQALGASVLVNASNVAWFGDSLALPEHLQISRMRARETARPMLRATNTGMTAQIDERGEVKAMLPPFSRAALSILVQPMRGNTPYSSYTDWPLWLICTLALAVMAIEHRRATRRARGIG
jgi:apolipoprotein N-acyltransferase